MHRAAPGIRDVFQTRYPGKDGNTMRKLHRMLIALVLVTGLPAIARADPPLVPVSYKTALAVRYPPAAIRDLHQGTVQVLVLVRADGSAGRTLIRTSSGFPELDAAALDAVSAVRFNPATRDGVAVDSWVLVPINFKLPAYVQNEPRGKDYPWQLVTTEPGSTWYVGKRVQAAGQSIRVWVLQDRDRPLVIGHMAPILSNVGLWQIDCGRRTDQRLLLTGFSRHRGQGAVVIAAGKAAAVPIEAPSVGALVAARACSQPAPASAATVNR
ncbi:MAG: energy transducer TonB [Xanthomonadaceae bacterium]|nr:energy transducer TonB [Xanthomonadaceae bacterium]